MYTVLLIIDPQNDFCKAPKNIEITSQMSDDDKFNIRGGSLYVPGADQDMIRLAKFINNNSMDINDIYITFDDHKRLDISHPMWWSDAKGNQPEPFTIITKNDIDKGKWFARIPEYQGWSEIYIQNLANQGNYPHVIWPYHCIAGTQGAAMVNVLDNAVADWSFAQDSFPEIIRKGENPLTEHYSAVKAEVVMDDINTQVNENLVNELMGFDIIYVAGEAMSHCLGNTVRDLIHNDIDPTKVVVISDCTTSVPTFEEIGMAFQREMESIGVKFKNSEDI